MQNWEYILGVSSIVLLVIPVTLLVANRKEGGASFLALAFYFLQVIIVNLISTGLVQVSERTELYAGITNNLLDAPLMLVGLRYFTLDTKKRRQLLLLAIAYLVFELVVFLFAGFNGKFLTIAIGPGLLLVLALSTIFFIYHVKESFNRSKDKGKAFMSGSLVFAYVCFTFMYLLHYVMLDPNYNDLLKIYHLTYIVLSICMSMGLIIIIRAKRKKPKPEITVKQEDVNAFQYL